MDQLLKTCHTTQARHTIAVSEPQLQKDFISLLPKEVSKIESKLSLGHSVIDRSR
jgi:hypothetical protein